MTQHAAELAVDVAFMSAPRLSLRVMVSLSHRLSFEFLVQGSVRMVDEPPPHMSLANTGELRFIGSIGVGIPTVLVFASDDFSENVHHPIVLVGS